ncbi:MAG TPA: glycoside hydrolase family 3 C-terminal domain-containing protein [Anaerolineaceae bacterium]|nr:glycoside hydrolase family 3 C-terminal domain-containing protein [Anaerolineaceae bacterium]
MPNYKTILSQLTLEEKAALVAGLNMWQTKANERLGILSIMMTNGPHGVQKQSSEATDFAGMSNSLPATCFPPAVIQAATWNRELIHEMGAALGEECRQEKVSILLGPGINIKRSPLGGRNYDYYSEDPYFTSEMAGQLIMGIESQGIGTSLKHFAVGSQEYRRMTINAIVDERALREIYLSAFEKVVKDTQPWTVMNAYTLVNGTYCSENPYLISEILKKEWGYQGVVLSDWGSVNDRVAGLKAQIDLEMPGPAIDNQRGILAAVKAGNLPEAALDRAVERLLALIFKAQETLAKDDYIYDKQAHHDLARRIAEEGTVLLKNENQILPIPETAKIALLGHFAQKPRFQGTGSSLTNPTRVDNLYHEMIQRIGETHVLYAPGFPEKDTATVDDTLLNEALEVAAQADYVIVMVGVSVAEGGDQPNMKLPDSQAALIEKVTDLHQHVIVLLSNGNPLEMPWLNKVPAVLEGYLAGQAGASAQADILLGRANPSGKIGETFPIKLEDNPSYPYYPGGPAIVEYRESIYVGYRYYDTAHVPVLFPFGHGLSYTTFEYRDLRAQAQKDSAKIIFKIKNAGNRTGKEAAQVYVRDVESSHFRPVKELKGFVKVHLNPNEEKEVTIELDRRDFSFYDVGKKEWVLEAGDFEIMVGASSQDIRLTTTLWLDSDQQASVCTDKAALASYFSVTPAPISRDAFAALYGKSLPENVTPQKGSYTLNTPFGDMKDSWLARQLLTLMNGQVKKMVGGDDPDNPLLAMAENMLNEMPLRAIQMMTNGAIKRPTLEALLLLINGKGLYGFGALIKSLVIK